MPNMSFIPEGYSEPDEGGGSNYLKLKKGVHRLRILSPQFYHGWCAWEDSKPHRARELESLPERLRKDAKHFWVVVVWNYDAQKIQLWDIPQATIRRDLHDLVTNEDWGHPSQYDIRITRVGEGMNDTRYKVVASPPVPTSDEVQEAYGETPVDIDAYFDGDDPFVKF